MIREAAVFCQSVRTEAPGAAKIRRAAGVCPRHAKMPLDSREESHMGSKDRGNREKKKPKKSKDTIVAPAKSRYDRAPQRPAPSTPPSTPSSNN
jgi:hypothetical protein